MNNQPLIFTFVSMFLFYASVEGADLESNDVPPVESGQQGGWSLWPSDVAGGGWNMVLGKFSREKIDYAKQKIDETLQKNIALADQATEQRIDQAHERGDQLLHQANNQAKDLVNHTGDRLDQTVARTLQREGPLDQATDRVLGQATQQLETAANRVVADATGQLRAASHQILTNEMQPVGHALIVDLAQNMGKMFLTSTMGGLGAVVAYKNLMAYLEEQKNTKAAYTYKETLLSKKLKEAGLIKADNQQTIRVYLAGAGATTFAAACILCCYWIR